VKVACVFTLDIGGAFIKTACLPAGGGRPKRAVVPFAMYRSPEKLALVLKSLKPGRDECLVAYTMTGELCDCFKNRARGVRHIVDSAEKAFGPSARVFSRGGALITQKQARRNWEDVASANWAVLPLWFGRRGGDFLLHPKKKR